MNMQELVDKLNKWTVAYDKGTPEISDEEWDNYYLTMIPLYHRLLQYMYFFYWDYEVFHHQEF